LPDKNEVGLIASCLIDLGDSGNICCLRDDWRCAGCKQGFHVTDSAQHYEIPNNRPAYGNLIFCDGWSLFQILPSEILAVIMQT